MYGFDVIEQEFWKPLFTSLDMLERSNVMFSGREVPFLKKYWRFFYMIPLLILHYISLTAYILKLFTEGIDPFEKADMLPLWLATVEFWINVVILMINQHKIREVIINMSEIWRITGLNEVQRKIKDDALNRLYYGGIAVNKVGLAVSWQYLLVPLCETVVRRLVLRQEVELQLPFDCVYPFETSSWPVYLAIYAFQVYCIFRTIYVYQGVGWLLVVLTTHLHVQFLLLQEDLIHINPVVDNKRSSEDENKTSPQVDTVKKNHIEDFIKRHQDTISLAKKMDACCNKFTFTIMLFATLIICFFAVAAKASTGTAYALNNYGAIIVILMSILILCYSSQLLSSSSSVSYSAKAFAKTLIQKFISSGIALAAAKNLWYEGNMRYQTSICFIIMRSQKPCSLTLLGFLPIDLGTFNKVLKTTWSYFSLASHMYDKKRD